MQLKKITLAETKAFSPFLLDYLERKESLKQFYHRYPEIPNFDAQIREKGTAFPKANRMTLVSVLRKQYEGLTSAELAAENIGRLADAKTFTVTTGHQLNIFTGPLYFIYKIVTVINACKKLKEQYPDFHFVPVYWMASEDHDYDEIKYFRLYGKKYTWETGQKGAVGRFTTPGLTELSEQIPGDVGIFKEAYGKGKTLAEAVRRYVNALFGKEGVVVVDADNRDLKQIFTPVMAQDIFDGVTVDLVNRTNKELSGKGYTTQVHCRDVNFFYLDDNLRSRIEKRGDRYVIVDTSLSYTATELKKIMTEEPEKFSPNVILRPLYQEMILPNLAYVGGPAEVVYWLQLKKVFEKFQVPFPMLVPRNFAMVIDHTIQRKLEKTGLPLEMFFEEKNFLFNHWVLMNSRNNLNVGEERAIIQEIYNQLKKRAEAIDKTLGPFTAAEGTRVMNGLERIERKLLRAEKRLHADKLRQIEAVKDTLFPNGGLQERADNFLNFYQQDGKFVTKLISCLDPFDFRFNVLTYENA
jgi:bacillithiol biosynthesis cysteine-adding enzyme BshC